LRFKKVVLQRKPGIHVYNLHLHAFLGPFLKKKLSLPNKRGKGNNLYMFKGQKCDEKEILETYGDVRKLLTWNV